MNKQQDSKHDLAAERKKIILSFQNAILSPHESSEVASQKEEKIDLDYENEKLTLDNRIEKRKVRKGWNLILACLVVFGFLLSYALIIATGLGLLKFESSFAVPSVVAAGIIQTYGLAKLAIMYFFSEDGGKKG